MWEFLNSVFDPVQLVGYIGMLCALSSYQCKKNRNYFLFQTGCSLAFAVQFALLSSYAGMLVNIFSIMRGIIFAVGDKCRKKGYLVLMLLCFAFSSVISVLVFGELWWIALFLFAAQGSSTLAMWTRNGKTIRYVQLLCVSPLWLVNNIYYVSIGGVVCEVCNMISVLVSFIRFRKTGYDKT